MIQQMSSSWRPSWEAESVKTISNPAPRIETAIHCRYPLREINSSPCVQNLRSIEETPVFFQVNARKLHPTRKTPPVGDTTMFVFYRLEAEATAKTRRWQPNHRFQPSSPWIKLVDVVVGRKGAYLTLDVLGISSVTLAITNNDVVTI